MNIHASKYFKNNMSGLKGILKFSLASFVSWILKKTKDFSCHSVIFFGNIKKVQAKLKASNKWCKNVFDIFF